MRLEKALQKVLRFAGKSKAPSILRTVRFLPAERPLSESMSHIQPLAMPPRLVAKDGSVGCFVAISHGDLPNVLLPAERLKPVAKQTVLRLTTEGNAVIFETDGGVHRIEALDPRAYPGWPQPPLELHELEHWEQARKVIHAAGVIAGKPELACVHFHPGHVVATDQDRVAIADVPTGLSGLVPMRLFTSWPKNSAVHTAVRDGYVFFRLAGELRFAELMQVSTPDYRQFVPEWHSGPYTLLPSRDLLEAVKQAVAATPSKHVRVQPGATAVSIESTQGEFRTEVPGVLGLTAGHGAEYPAMVVLGKYLLEAVKAVDTERVRLCYGMGDHLRLEHGAVTECVWLTDLRRAA